MDAKLLQSLSKADAETLEAAEIILSVFKEMEDIRKLANQINKENGALMNEILTLRREKAALVTFIDTNVSDEKLKAEIFKGDK